MRFDWMIVYPSTRLIMVFLTMYLSIFQFLPMIFLASNLDLAEDK